MTAWTPEWRQSYGRSVTSSGSITSGHDWILYLRRSACIEECFPGVNVTATWMKPKCSILLTATRLPDGIGNMLGYLRLIQTIMWNTGGRHNTYMIWFSQQTPLILSAYQTILQQPSFV